MSHGAAPSPLSIVCPLLCSSSDFKVVKPWRMMPCTVSPVAAACLSPSMVVPSTTLHDALL
eukprot:6116875-Alexandrium_andersonii.AAC.1